MLEHVSLLKNLCIGQATLSYQKLLQKEFLDILFVERSELDNMH